MAEDLEPAGDHRLRPLISDRPATSSIVMKNWPSARSTE
jgi:hypothetical protein